MKMAEAVGLGGIGKNGLLFHSKYGPRLMLGGLLTDAELPAMAWPQRDEAKCPRECFICQEACPVGALESDGTVDRLACLKASMKSPLFTFMMKAGKWDPAEVPTLNLLTGVDDHSMYTCIKCVSACPHG